jgi:hypothetical protein
VRKYIALVLALIMAFTLAACNGGNSTPADNTQSPSPSPSQTGGARSVTVDGRSIDAGDIVSSGTIRIDNDSFILLDTQTRVVVNDVSENSLAVTLLDGAIYADITRRNNNDQYEIRAGNSTLRVRGTEFVVEFDGNGNPVFIMLDGSGEVDGVTLDAGNYVVADTDDIGIIMPIGTGDGFSDFVRDIFRWEC